VHGFCHFHDYLRFLNIFILKTEAEQDYKVSQTICVPGNATKVVYNLFDTSTSLQLSSARDIRVLRDLKHF
jgi:hypothetical protein